MKAAIGTKAPATVANGEDANSSQSTREGCEGAVGYCCSSDEDAPAASSTTDGAGVVKNGDREEISAATADLNATYATQSGAMNLREEGSWSQQSESAALMMVLYAGRARVAAARGYCRPPPRHPPSPIPLPPPSAGQQADSIKRWWALQAQH